MAAWDRSLGLGDTAIVFSDLFISATATLLLTLAVLNDHPDDPVPPQADLIARCANDGLALMLRGAGDDAPVHRVAQATDLGRAAAVLRAPARLFQSIALVSADRVLPVECLDRALRLVRDWNIAADEVATDVAPVIYGLSPVTAPEEEP